MSQHTQCPTLGWRGAPPPRPPDGRSARRPRRFGPPSMRPVAGSARLAASAGSAGDATGRLSSPRRGGSACHEGGRRVKRCRVPSLRSGPLGDSPAVLADGGWLLTDAGVRLVNETGIDGSTVPPAPIVASGIAGAAAREALPGGTNPTGSDPATGVTEERPSRRETAGFGGSLPAFP